MLNKVYRFTNILEIVSWFVTYMFVGYFFVLEILTPSIFTHVGWRLLLALVACSVALCIINIILESALLKHEKVNNVR